ncbi:MAG: hypothetical protein AAF805_02290 [Planctomycetota bacterium]
MKPFVHAACVALAVAPFCGVAVQAEEHSVAGGTLTLTAPASFREQPPRMAMIEREFSVASPAGTDSAAARMTMMRAGGSTDANLARWIGQFQGTEGGADRSESTITKRMIDSMPVTTLDHSGVYLDRPRGPFGPVTPTPGYRMLAAIVETGGDGSFFVKLVGPEPTVAAAADDFTAMIESIRRTDD